MSGPIQPEKGVTRTPLPYARAHSHTKMTAWYGLRILFQRGERIKKKVWCCDVKTVDSRQKKTTSSEVN